MSSEDYFLVSIALLIAIFVAVFFGATIGSSRYVGVEGLILVAFEMVSTSLFVGFLVSGIIKDILERRRYKKGG